MIFFVVRVDSVGEVSSILCGAVHFIRCSIATGEYALKKRFSDDDVGEDVIEKVWSWMAIPFVSMIDFVVWVYAVLFFLLP
jgi:hypothetical protein